MASERPARFNKCYYYPPSVAGRDATHHRRPDTEEGARQGRTQVYPSA